MSFKNLGLSKSLLSILKIEEYHNAYPIQSNAIPQIIAGKDIIGIAKTGSGKTASYVLPIVQELMDNQESKTRNIKVLVLVPTRELAEQVKDVFRTFSREAQLKIMAAYGGVSINPQMKNLFGVDVLIATPGRLIELVESKAVSLSKIKMLVLDEADKLMNKGFEKEFSTILGYTPKNKQNILFSATLHKDLDAISKLFLNNPQIIKIEEEEDNIELINQVGYFVEENKKGPLLRYLIKTKDITQALVFTSSIYKADNVADKLRRNGINASAIHGKKSQGARKKSLAKFKNGSINILVATDLLSRGIDIESLPFVINYELPRSPKDFIHRIGRTGRAANAGEAISFVSSEANHHFKVIQKKMGKWVTMIDISTLDI